ncbi:alpha/beta fold hydrolase [Stackebrandtia nassauensis]|uniref:AB hydrolase-1 domain-containing protein n=1 Tax=Stackebrandtia nassauensis (strain DSM 44728 / CIP 108903 / NRRL B-16338 / NBRC 102104 / LLR-40K-21) TaxID=446470 RepID=D3Q7H0_STANL|nr:alpha/beta hydrolase [Stackebrandtia nassauensis]ADD44312.1 conserved hypothetical protein [Stackebrandtia nassauensis DSM 44728]
MSTFVLIHGANSSSWDWHLVAPELRALGHEVIAPDLPTGSPTATLTDYTDAVVKGIEDHDPKVPDDLVVVAHSLGGFTAPLVCHRVPARLLVLVNGMIPRPGETVADWWSNTGQSEATAGTDYDEHETFFHDVTPELEAKALAQVTGQGEAAMLQPWPAESWPEVPTKHLVGRDDRLFPAVWARGLARQRLGITTDEMDGGHYLALSRPAELALRLDAYTH